jgi:hypothetical protein
MAWRTLSGLATAGVSSLQISVLLALQIVNLCSYIIRAHPTSLDVRDTEPSILRQQLETSCSYRVTVQTVAKVRFHSVPATFSPFIVPP